MLDDISEDTLDALEMIGHPIVQFDPPSQQIIQTDRGFKTVTTQGWIKFAIRFRNILSEMKGAKMSVYMCICLHVNEHGRAWPNLNTICAETGYERAAVIKAIKSLSDMGILEIAKNRGRVNIYSPYHAAYGGSIKKDTPTSSEKRTTVVAKSEPEVELLSRTKEEEKPIPRTWRVGSYRSRIRSRAWNWRTGLARAHSRRLRPKPTT